MNDIEFIINPKNKNYITFKQKINNKVVESYIAIPSGYNRTDIITNKELINGYNYNVDAIIIISNDSKRRIYYKNKFQIEF
jgi:hypothetical protein